MIAITKDAALGRAVRAERDRRVLSSVALQEFAAKHAIKGPPILAGIMTDEAANPRHKIDAFQALRQTAIGSGDDHPAKSEQFVIRIDLTAGGGGIEEYSKTIDASARDVTPSKPPAKLVV